MAHTSPRVLGTGRRRLWWGGKGRRPDICLVMLEAENWKIVFETYKGHPIPALLLAHQLMAVKQSLQRGRKGIPEAIEGLDLAIDSLYPHTDFHRLATKLYRRTIEGTITPKQEELISKLDGIINDNRRRAGD